MVKRFSNVIMGIGAVVATCTVPAGVHASVSLEWRPATPTVNVGEVVQIGLYAVSDGDNDQSVGGIDAAISWDADILELSGLLNNGSYQWLMSGFPDDSQLDGLNGTWLDGDAFYVAVRRSAPYSPAFATPDGLLVATFVFTAVGSSSASELSFLTSGGEFSATRVLDGYEAGRLVTGALGSAVITILLCGAAADVDRDCDVDSVDFEWLALCLSGPPGGALAQECQRADTDGDGDVDLRDFGVLQQTFWGP